MHSNIQLVGKEKTNLKRKEGHASSPWIAGLESPTIIKSQENIEQWEPKKPYRAGVGKSTL